MATGDLKIDALLFSDKPLWRDPDPSTPPMEITVSFMTQVPGFYEKNAPERNNFIALDQAQQMGSLYKLYCWGWKNGALEHFPLFQHWLLSIFLYYRRGFAEGSEWKQSQIEGSEWRQNQMER